MPYVGFIHYFRSSRYITSNLSLKAPAECPDVNRLAVRIVPAYAI